MAFESVNYQCPACGGPLHFASAEQKLVCDYCDSRFEVEEVEALYRERQDKADAKADAAAATPKPVADDAVQDTYLRYCSYDKEFTDEDHLRAWLLRVAINRARDQKRSFWEKHRVSWEDYMETLVFEAPEDKSLFEAVMSLPAKYRTVIHLFYYEDYSVARIAEILHSREGTVKSQLNRGRQLLKTKLMEAWNDDE